MSNAIARVKLSLRKSSPRTKDANPFFEVKEVPLVRIDGVPTNLRDIVNAETNKSLGTVSDKYNVTTHREASNLVKSFLDEIGLRYECPGGARISTAGSRFYETLTFPDYAFNPLNMGNPSTALDAKGYSRDDLVPTITIRNSYDKTSPVAWNYGMYRLLCGNGMAILEEMVKLSYKHTQIINKEHVRSQLLRNLEGSTLLVGQIMARLNAEDGTEHLVKLLQSGFSDSFKEKLLVQIAPFAEIAYKDEIDEGKTIRVIDSIKANESAYAVYNIATDIATHEIGNAALQENVGRKIARVFEIAA